MNTIWKMPRIDVVKITSYFPNFVHEGDNERLHEEVSKDDL
jgi:hypothetical protein